MKSFEFCQRPERGVQALPTPYTKINRSPFLKLTREHLVNLCRNETPAMTEQELARLTGLNETISLKEVREVYFPLSKLIHLHVKASQQLYVEASRFLQSPSRKVPFILGIAGSVAAGKSTTARVLQHLLAGFPEYPRVDLVTTDGFLFPNEVLEAKGLLRCKGFPESYDIKRLLCFLADVKAGLSEVRCPVYSHFEYNIVKDRHIVVQQPDILIVEGLNVLQVGGDPQDQRPRVFVSDFFDYSIYVDAQEDHIVRWFLERFLMLRTTAFRNPASYFRRYADVTEDEAIRVAKEIWETINGINLKENILPTKGRADLILTKGYDHSVEQIQIRKL
ncbi:type I pantothenate kinase [Paenibacillus larvae]